jgi:hypothetical protein
MMRRLNDGVIVLSGFIMINDEMAFCIAKIVVIFMFVIDCLRHLPWGGSFPRICRSGGGAPL